MKMAFDSDVPKYQNISGCCGSGVKSDYMSFRCPICKQVWTWDFATD